MIKDIIYKKQDYVNSLDPDQIEQLKKKLAWASEELNSNPLVAYVNVLTWLDVSKMADDEEAYHAEIAARENQDGDSWKGKF